MQLVRERQPSFARGFNDQAAPDEYGENEVEVLQDGHLTENGNGARRRGGSQRTHSSQLNGTSTCYGLFEFTAQSQLVAFFGDTGYYSTDNGQTWSQMATGLREDYWSIVETDVCGTQELVLANGSSDIYTWDGSSWSAIAGDSAQPTGVKYLAVFNGRLYVAGHAGDSVAASEVADFTVWKSADGGIEVKVTTHDGDVGITGLFQMGTSLLAFKRKSTAYIEGFGHRTLQVEAGARGMSRSVGCVSHHSIAPLGDNGVMWLSERGFEVYGLGSGSIRLMSRPVEGFVDTIDYHTILDDDGIPASLYWQDRDEYWCAVPTNETGRNDTIFVFREPTSRTPESRWAHVPSFQPAALAMANQTGKGQRPHAGGYDGWVREMERGNKDDVNSDGTGGDDITMVLRSRPFFYGNQHLDRRGRIVRASITPGDDDQDVTVRVIADGNVDSERTVSWPQRTSNILTESEAELTTESGSPLLTNTVEGPISDKVRMNGRGNILQVEFAISGDSIVNGIELGAENLRRAW